MRVGSSDVEASFPHMNLSFGLARHFLYGLQLFERLLSAGQSDLLANRFGFKCFQINHVEDI